MKNLKVLGLGFFLVLTNLVIAQEKKVYQDFSAELKFDEQFFFNEPLYEGQHRNYFSGALQPEYIVEWDDDSQTFKVVLFGRLDQYDNRRTHFDIRELYWQKVKGSTEFSIGLKKVFWGVTESSHLVDIINQTDVVESFDGEEKLGQPMVHVSQFTNFGILDFFYLPYFRKPTYPGQEGRLRTPFVLDSDEFNFHNGRSEWYPSFAARYSNSVGPFDLGLSYFHGIGREPIVADLTTFNPQFAQINQIGFDIQATTGPVLWKYESILRQNDILDMFALVAGFEYTFGNVFNTGADVGIVAEYLYDDRDELAFNSLQNDVFTGVRLGFNDIQSTDFLFGTIVDLEHSTKLISVEGSRRVGNSWKVELEARLFRDVDQVELLYFFRQDSFAKATISKFF